MIHTQYDAIVQEWFSDDGGEYISNRYVKLLKEKGIEIFRSVPSQKQMNGRAERFNRTIDEKSESMRHLACLPDSWWEFSVLHALYLYMRTPVKRLEWATPIESLKREKPDLSKLRIFGSGAYVFIHEEIRKNKLSPKSELMIFLGYRFGHQSNMVFMRAPNNVLFYGTTALFDENMFPKCLTKKVPTVTPVRNKPKKSTEENPIVGIEFGSASSDDSDDGSDHIPPYLRSNEQERSKLGPPLPPRPPTDPSSRLPPPPHPSRGRGSDRVFPPSGPRGSGLPSRTRGSRGRGTIGPPPGDAGPSGTTEDGPRRSGRERTVPKKPGNVYPEGTTVDKDLRKPLGKPWKGNLSVSVTELPTDESSDTTKKFLELNVANSVTEGGEYKWINDLLSKAISAHDSLPDPEYVRDWTSKDIDRLPADQQQEWRKAQFEELEALKRRNVFELTSLPPGRHTIKNRWTFDIKTDGRKRARLVAKGFSQIEGLDYEEIFSPVVRFETIRTILALAALEKWSIESLDVKSAFLYGKLDEEIYMEQPSGFIIKGKEHLVLRLLRAIYGLKQAARAWWTELDRSLKEFGFKRLYVDAGIFVAQHPDGTLIFLLAYIDDIIITGPTGTHVHQRKRDFMDKWECRDLGVCREFLRMRIKYENGKILLDQTDYLRKVLKRFGMTDAKMAKTPLPMGYKPEPFSGTSNSQLRSQYQSLIGSLLYIMLGTRPDIAFAVTQMAKFASNPSDEHLNRAMYILRYLVGTRDYALVFDGNSNEGLIAYCDASYGDDKTELDLKRRSTQGYFFKLADACIKWHTRTQKMVATSSTAAEYMALSDCARDCAWFKTLFAELGKPVDYVPLCGDSRGAIFNAQNPVTQKGIKHIEIRYHYIREQIELGTVKLYYVPTYENIADMFTKNLGPNDFLRHRSELGLEFYPLSTE